MEEQALENKERTVYLSSTGDFVKTDLTNPREIKYASEIQLANKERDKFYGLKAIPQDRAEITKAAMDSERGYFKQAAAGVGSSVVGMGQNLWNWARYTNANLIGKARRKLNEYSASILKGTGAIDEETRANMMKQVNNDYKAVRDIINAEMLANREKQNAYLEKTGLAKREGDSLVYDIANGVGSAAAALGLAIVTKSPNAAALMFGGVAGQSGYEEALAAGIEPEKALKVGAARGFFESLFEKVGIHCYIEGLATRGVFARIAKNALVEGIQEVSQQTAEEILQTKYGGRTEDWKRSINDILLSGFVGMIVGGGFASVGAGQSMLEEQKAKDTGAKPLPTQQAQNIDLTDAFESGVKRFTDLGMPLKDAENLTFSLLKKAAEPETAKEIVDMIREENSNLTYINNDEDQNAAAVAEAIKQATAPERVVKQQAFDIADKVEEQALKAGRTPEEAAASAEIAQKASMGLYNLTGVLPQDQYNINIALEQDGLDASENGLTGQEDTSFDVSTFNQAAAMYRNKANNLAEFRTFAKENQGNEKEDNKSFYQFKNADGVKIDVPFERVLHIDKDHNLTDEQLSVVENEFNKPEYAVLLPGVGEYNGRQVKLKFNTSLGKAGAVIEIMPNGRIFLNTAFFDSDENIDNWAKENLPNTPSEKPVFIGGGNNSITDIVEKVKGQTLYQEPNAPRGSVTFADDIKQAFIKFNKTADKSTLVHELGHIWLKNIEKFADYAKNPEFAEFKQNLDSWLGAPVNGVYTREQQEKFAKTFERYLQEGKAPNAELQSIFDKFKEWLTEIYNAVKNYIELTPEAIKTFDTLLAPEKGGYNIDKIKSKTAQAKAVVEKIKKGQAVSIDGVGVQDIKEAVKVMNSRIPAEPKENLLRTLRSKGADYAAAGKIDKEQYKNARVPNKKDGIQDGLALTLRDWGYMDFDDSAVADYEGLSEQDEKAADLIDRALSGEKIYKVNDPQAAKREEFLADVEKAREVLGPNGEEVARAISTLEKKGYRVVEKADIAYLEKQLDQLNNIVDKARILEQNTEEQKKTAEFDKMQKQSALEARRIKTAVIEELGKRDIAGKETMFEDLQKAETPEEIFTAATDILTELEKEFANTEEGQAEQRKIDIPSTNWEAKKVTLLKDIAEISANASKEEQEARQVVEQYHLSRTGFAPSVQPKELERARRVLNQSLEKKFAKAFNDALMDEPHIESKDKARLIKSYLHRALEMKGVSKITVDWFFNAAKDIQETNYKKYMKGKIKDILDLNLFDKQGNLRKALVDPVTLNTLQDLKRVARMKQETAASELADRMERFAKQDEGINPADKIINELLSIKAHDDKDISVQLFKKTYDDIHDLRQSGRSAKNLQKIILDYKNEQAKSELLDAIDKNKEAGWIKRTYASWLANWESMLDIFADNKVKERYSMLNTEADTITHTWKRRTEIMDGVKRIYDLSSNAEVQNKMNELRNEKYTFTNYALVDKNKNPYVFVRKTGKPFKEELSKMQIITAYIYSKNAELEKRLLLQYGQDQLEDMWSKLDKRDKLLANFLQQEAEKSYNQINEVFVKERGYDLPKVDNYFPSVTERVESELDFLHASAVMSKNPSFTKMRVASPFVQMKLENPFGILFRHIDRAADYHFKAEKLNQIRRVFKSPAVKPAIIEKVGEDVYKRMLELIDQFSVQKQTLKYDIDKLGDWLTNNYVKGAIALKPTIAIKQLISSMNYAENMPTGQWIKGFTDAIMHPKQTIDFMMNGDPYLKARYESGSMNEALARATADANAITARGKFLRFTDLLTINTRLGDIGAIIFGGKPYVDYLMNEKGMSKADAFAEFRKSTLRSQQSNTRSSLSTLQAHDMNWLLRGLFAFKNTPAQYARKIADGISQYQRGEIDAKQLGKVVAIYGLLNSWMYSMLTTLGLLAWFYDRDEAKELMTDELIFSPFTQMASSLPVLDMAVGQAANVAKAKMFKHRVQLERPEMPVVSDIFKMGSKALKEDVTAEDVLDMLVTGGQVFGGLPTKYGKGLVTGAAATVSGKNPMRGFLQALGYTENRAGKITGDEKKKKKKRKKK